MGLQRTTMMAAYPHVGTKDFYAAADVDALLARIRAAVETERDAAWSCFSPHEGIEAYRELYDEECSALDALLADGGA